MYNFVIKSNRYTFYSLQELERWDKSFETLGEQGIIFCTTRLKA